MGFLRPTTKPSTFDFWDNPAIGWPKLFMGGNRSSQRTAYGTSFAVENALASDLLRFYADILAHTDFDVARTVQNMQEFKHGGAIDIALNQDMKLGFIWNYRPLIPHDKVLQYRAAWKKFAHVPSKGLQPEKVHDFLEEVVPLIGLWSLELARGYGSPTATAVATGQSEAEEELQVRCTEVRHLTQMAEDTAQVPAPDDIFLAFMDVKGKPSKPVDLWEKIAARAEWGTMSEYEQAVRDRLIVDPYTPMGIELLRVFDRATYDKIAQ